jgi:hypothetical protein
MTPKVTAKVEVWVRLGRLKWALGALACVCVVLPAVLLVVLLLLRVFHPTLLSDNASEWDEWVRYVSTWAPRILSAGLPATLVAILSQVPKALELLPKLNVAKYLAPLNYKEKVSFLERFHEHFTNFTKRLPSCSRP